MITMTIVAIVPSSANALSGPLSANPKTRAIAMPSAPCTWTATYGVLNRGCTLASARGGARVGVREGAVDDGDQHEDGERSPDLRRQAVPRVAAVEGEKAVLRIGRHVGAEVHH